MKVKLVEWALLACLLALSFMAVARPVREEDDCAPWTWVVTRMAGQLWCVGEGWRKNISSVRPNRPAASKGRTA
jgi:hypothetical protein